MAVGLTYSVGGIRSNRDQSKTLLAEKRSPRETARERLLKRDCWTLIMIII